MKRSTLGSGGQSSRSHKAENTFRYLAQASFLTPLGRVGHGRLHNGISRFSSIRYVSVCSNTVD